MSGGEAGLQGHHPGCRGSRVGVTGQAQHGFNMRQVCRARLAVALLVVVGLVGQAEAALVEIDDVAVGLAVVGVDDRLERPVDALVSKPAEQGGQLGRVLQPGNGVEEVVQTGEAGRFDRRLVHEGLVEGDNFRSRGRAVRPGARGRAGPTGRSRLDDVPQLDLGLLAENVEGSIPAAVGWDLGARDPPSVDVAEEVILWADGGVDVSDANP